MVGLNPSILQSIELIAAGHGCSGSCGTPAEHLDQNILGSGSCSARKTESIALKNTSNGHNLPLLMGHVLQQLSLYDHLKESETEMFVQLGIAQNMTHVDVR